MQQCLAVNRDMRCKRICQRLVVRAMDLFDPALELAAFDRPPPELSVAMGARGDEAEPVARTRADRRRRNAEDRGGIDLLLVAIAVDYRARHRLDDRPDPGGDGSPRQPVHQRVLQRFQRTAALGRVRQHRLVIVPARMGHGQQHGHGTARRVDGR